MIHDALYAALDAYEHAHKAILDAAVARAQERRTEGMEHAATYPPVVERESSDNRSTGG